MFDEDTVVAVGGSMVIGCPKPGIDVHRTSRLAQVIVLFHPGVGTGDVQPSVAYFGGHIVRDIARTVGPICIAPEYKRKGYGLKLLNYALEKAKGMGVGLLSMEGNIDFYKHAGFDLACKLKIHYHAEPRNAEVPYFLAQELIPGYWGNREGTYCPPQGYFVADENPAAFEAYEATFPYKEKLRLPGQLGYEE